MTGGPEVIEVVPAAAADEIARATAGGHWTLRWRGWADWPLSRATIVLAAVAVALDVTTAWTGVSLGALGRIPISPALPLALVLVARLHTRRRGRSGPGRGAWREFAVGIGVVLALATVGYAVALGRPVEAVGLIVAAVGEELVFRLAAVLVIGAAVAAVLGRDWARPNRWGAGPGIIGLTGAALVFTALPGHVDQITLGTGAVSSSFLVGSTPVQLTTSDTGTALYVLKSTSGGAGADVGVVDTATESQTRALPAPADSVGLQISPDGRTLFLVVGTSSFGNVQTFPLSP